MNSGLTRIRASLAGGAAVLSLGTTAALAQEQVEQVVVSSTRLQTAGFDAPTPTTVVSSADLQAQAKPNIFDALTSLPALQGSSGVSYNTVATSNGLIGLSALGLRGLSPLRTLVLLDSQRVVASNYNGVVDVSEMPQMLVSRVDVVTGGASASWGSDAVAGVVNFVTEKKFEGFKSNAMTGLSTYGDMGTATFQVAAGTSFAGGRAHFEVSGEYSYNAGLLPRYPTNSSFAVYPENFGGRQLSRLSGTSDYGVGTAPAGQPRFVYAPLTQFTQNSAYGLITTGSKAFTAFNAQGQPQPFALAGNCFVNNAGTPAATLSGSIPNVNTGNCLGSLANPGDQTHRFISGVIDPITRGALYTRLSYDLTPDTEIFATVLYSQARTQNTPAGGGNEKTVTLKCDNAYLPSSNVYGVGLTAAQVLAACNTGTGAAAGGNFTFGSGWAIYPVDQQVFNNRVTRRYTIGGNGRFDLFGKSWNWDSYFQHGETDDGIHIQNMILSNSPIDPTASAAQGKPVTNAALSRLNLALDSVVNSLGNIVCRNTVAQLNGCVPINPFGGTTISQGAMGYVLNQNGPGGSTIGPTAIQTGRQEAFSFSVNGSPIEDWAGPIAVAAGVEYREEHYSQRGDPYAAGISASTPATVNEPCTDPAIDCGQSSLGSLGAYSAGNYHNARGTYHVNEAFIELGVPLLNNAFWGKADLDLGGRHARYSTAGDANTWKVGLTWDTPLPGIRLRALQSRDIRAPNLSELFAPVTGINSNFVNRVTGQTGQAMINITQGNTLLKPERSQTTEAGIVWQPDFLNGFQMSVDYYRIVVKGATSALSVQQVEDQCILQNVQSYCGQDSIQTANGVNQSVANPGGPPAPGFSGLVANQIRSITSKPFNAASLATEGFDIEASYRFDLQSYDIPGEFNLRSLATNVSKYIIDTGIAGTQRNVEVAGYVNNGSGGNSTYTAFGGTVFTWKLEETQSYQNDVWGFNLTERWYADGTSQNKNAIVCDPGTCPKDTIQSPTINFDKVDAVLYLDVGANWNVTNDTQIYAKVDNVANVMPPDVGSQIAAISVYDVIGRMYRIGVRFSH